MAVEVIADGQRSVVRGLHLDYDERGPVALVDQLCACGLPGRKSVDGEHVHHRGNRVDDDVCARVRVMEAHDRAGGAIGALAGVCVPRERRAAQRGGHADREATIAGVNSPDD